MEKSSDFELIDDTYATYGDKVSHDGHSVFWESSIKNSGGLPDCIPIDDRWHSVKVEYWYNHDRQPAFIDVDDREADHINHVNLTKKQALRSSVVEVIGAYFS